MSWGMGSYELGDQLRIKAAWGVFHVGIYVGDPYGDGGEYVAHAAKGGTVALIALDEFAGGQVPELVSSGSLGPAAGSGRAGPEQAGPAIRRVVRQLRAPDQLRADRPGVESDRSRYCAGRGCSRFGLGWEQELVASSRAPSHPDCPAATGVEVRSEGV